LGNYVIIIGNRSYGYIHWCDYCQPLTSVTVMYTRKLQLKMLTTPELLDKPLAHYTIGGVFLYVWRLITYLYVFFVQK
jgi:hypothetical protein